MKIDFTLAFRGRTELTRDELYDLCFMVGVKHIEVWTQKQTMTVYDTTMKGWFDNPQEGEVTDECSVTCVAEVPDEWEKDLENKLLEILRPIFGEEDKTKTGDPMPEGPCWYLDDWDVYLS
jgi:hypothetical protein